MAMKAWQINDFEWVAVPHTMTREQIEAWYLKEQSMSREEADFYEQFTEIPGTATMETDYTPDGRMTETTVEAVIHNYIERNGSSPFLLACTEY